MKTYYEIEAKIKEVTESNHHVLDCGMATIDINAPRAMMQLSAISALEMLYWTIDQKRPRFICDEK